MNGEAGAAEVPVRTTSTAGLPPVEPRLSGRRVLILGAGQMDDLADGAGRLGIGRATSVLLGREGAIVACLDRELGRAEATIAAVEAAGGEAIALAGDATEEDDVKRALAEAAERIGQLDGLVLNVGVVAGGPLEETDYGDLTRTLRTNVGSPFLGLKYGLPALREGGAVVIVSALAAVKVGPTPLPYDASKAALAALLRQGARYGERLGVRVNMVVPGAISTPMAANAFGGPHPLTWGREGSPWEVAEAIAFLLGEQSAYVNATDLVVDGGLLALH